MHIIKYQEDFLQEKFVNPLSDFGFKKLFKEEENKDIFLAFLQGVLPYANTTVSDIIYQDTEILGDQENDRTAICDIICTSEDNRTFLVEMQRVKQEHFVKRARYYMAKLTVEQSHSGPWDYKLGDIIFIGITDFDIPGVDTEPNRYISTYQQCDLKTGAPLRNGETYIFLNLKNFRKEKVELETPLDKMIYSFKHINDESKELDAEDIEELKKLKTVLAVAKLSDKELSMYRASQKAEWDRYSTLQTAKHDGEALGFQKGEESGLKKGQIQIAKNMLKKGMDLQTISEVTGITEEKLKQL